MQTRASGYFWIGVLSSLCLGLQVGCATVTAVRIPGPVAEGSVRLGDYRADVENVIDARPVNEYADGTGTTVRYEYKNGPHQASKARIVLYIAGDIFTLFLSEFLFWPIEAYASNQTTRFATAHYDRNNILIGFFVNRGGGDREQLIALGKRPEPPPDLAPSAVSAPPAQIDEPEGDLGVEEGGEDRGEESDDPSVGPGDGA